MHKRTFSKVNYPMNYFTPRFILRRFEILKQIKEGNTFLEIGAGSLNLTKDLLKFFENGTLVDYNEDVIKIFNNLPVDTINRLNLYIGDFFLINLQNKFDCIVACEVMEHIKNDKEFLKKIYSLLNTNGQVIISVPAKEKFWDTDDEIVGHFRRYEKKTVIKLLLDEHFSNINIISYGFPFINALRFPRIFLAKIQKNNKVCISMEDRSKNSGISPIKKLLKVSSVLINKYSFYPLCIIASFFNSFDFSDGYILTAQKIVSTSKEQ